MSAQSAADSPGRVAAGQQLSRAEVIDGLRQRREAERPDDDLFAEFLAELVDEVPNDDLEDRALDDLFRVAATHYDFGRVRAPHEPAIEVVETGSGAVVLLVTDDMPFLIDTMLMVLQRRHLELELLVHPVLAVERDSAGELTSLDAVDPHRSGQLVEAWTQLQIDADPGPATDALVEELRVVIADVRRVVADFSVMRQRLTELVDVHPALPWFATGNFVFLGAVTLDVAADGTATARPDSGLGQLRDADSSALEAFSFPAGTGSEPRTAMLARADTVATVFRPQRETVLIVNDPDHAGVEHRFIGLLSSAAQRASVLEVPGFGDEISRALGLIGDGAHTHSGRTARMVLENLPRDVVMEMTASEVATLVRKVMGLQERRVVRVFEVPEPVGLWTSVFVYFPRSRFTADIPERIADLVADAYGSAQREFESWLGTSTLARVTVSVRRPDAAADADLEALETLIAARTTVWSDRVRTCLVHPAGAELASLIDAAPAAYRAAVPADRAADDMKLLAALLGGTRDAVTAISHDDGDATAEYRIRIYRHGDPLLLADILPLLDHLGFVTVDEQPYEFEVDEDTLYLYDIGVLAPDGVELDDDRRADLRQAFDGLLTGAVESDGFNRLILHAGLDVREVEMLRCYARYLRQIGFSFSQAYLEETLTEHPDLAAMLVELFEVRGDPTFSGDAAARDERADEVRQRILDALDAIPVLDHDRICRMFLALIDATQRTNYFRDRSTIAIKFDPTAIPDLPLPRPAHEIWVCGPRVEGVHLRGSAVARGGLRWSDRREDFRTEVLGLMKAQMVKNAVIVPTGAKGGFVVKRQLPAGDERRAEVADCYRQFIRGMLDLTDNLVDGVVVHPPATVIHDADDTYLVVAADKGTATFSDLANEIAAEYDYWLGDAFASGGSVGYDHKEMGITARGAWESVRRHARTLGRDADADPLTVVGIGDMSGDVFGNGLLRSDAVRLFAAFDHRHIFVDPDPDPALSFAERKRLYELPRSSWADYSPDVLSAGGGVFPRTQKSIQLSRPAQLALGVNQSTFTPDQLISAILRAPVDLLWNGGIGTYVKAASEAHADVGDRTNDSLRVNGGELRCKMVGEGGNLGFTQLGRVEYALREGLIFTDAIDNSAGVDCSDHEVNIKILLEQLMQRGEISAAERVELLASMTDEVAELVLAHNQAQTLALTMARRQSLAMANVHARYIEALEAEGWLDRSLEFLPTDKQLAERQLAGSGLMTPEFAVLIAYTKNANVAEMVSSDLPDARLLQSDLVEYFPRPLRERFATAIAEHPLRREIVSTAVVNQMVNLSGISFDHRMTEDTGATIVDVTRAWLVAREVLHFPELWASIDELDGTVKLDVQLDLFLACRQMAERSTLWVLRHRRPPYAPADLAAEFAAGINTLSSSLGRVLRGRMAESVMSTEASRIAMHVPERLAEQSSVWPLLHTGFDFVELAAEHGLPVETVAAVHWALFDRLDVMWLWDGIGQLPRSDRWQTQARSAVRDDLLGTLAALTEASLPADASQVSEATADEMIDTWLAANERSVERVAAMLTEIRRADSYDLTTMSVALRQLRNLALTSNA